MVSPNALSKDKDAAAGQKHRPSQTGVGAQKVVTGSSSGTSSSGAGGSSSASAAAQAAAAQRESELKKHLETTRVAKEHAETKASRLEADLKVMESRQHQLEDRNTRLCKSLEEVHLMRKVPGDGRREALQL